MFAIDVSICNARRKGRISQLIFRTDLAKRLIRGFHLSRWQRSEKGHEREFWVGVNTL